MKVKIYENSQKEIWNNFLYRCKNSHFLFDRDFMEYHSDRFDDFSLLIYDDKDNLISLLPANKVEDKIYSHQGLTFGGFLVTSKIKLEIMKNILKSVEVFLKKEGFKELIYKSMPYIYHQKPFFEDIYLLRKNKAIIKNYEISEVIDLTKPIKYSNGRKHSIRKAKNFGFKIEKSKDFKSFWNILEDVLKTRHNSKPVHTLNEIEYLNSLFPKNIELFLVKKETRLYAGAVVFVNHDVVKLQYVANYHDGREYGALDFLIDYLIKERYKDKKYFDFGTSIDNNGTLNSGLIDQKERFGASAVLNDTYSWSFS